MFRAVADEFGALFVLNDRPDLVAACDADGVHVGQDDATPAAARAAVGPERIVGRSTHAPAQADAARATRTSTTWPSARCTRRRPSRAGRRRASTTSSGPRATSRERRGSRSAAWTPAMSARSSRAARGGSWSCARSPRRPIPRPRRASCGRCWRLRLAQRSVSGGADAPRPAGVGTDSGRLRPPAPAERSGAGDRRARRRRVGKSAMRRSALRSRRWRPASGLGGSRSRRSLAALVRRRELRALGGRLRGRRQAARAPAAFVFSALMLVAAVGMWQLRYWAVLGFEALLGDHVRRGAAVAAARGERRRRAARAGDPRPAAARCSGC